MVNINCPTAIYKILSYVSPLPSRELFGMSNSMDNPKASSSGLLFSPKPLFLCFPMKRMLFSVVVLHFEHYQQKCSSLWWSLIGFPTSADVLQVVTRSCWFSFHCTEYVVLHNGSKGVEIRKAKTTSSLSCQPWTPWKSRWHKIFSPKPKAPKGVAGTQQWYLQISPTYTPWLALHTPR